MTKFSVWSMLTIDPSKRVSMRLKEWMVREWVVDQLARVSINVYHLRVTSIHQTGNDVPMARGRLKDKMRNHDSMWSDAFANDGSLTLNSRKTWNVQRCNVFQYVGESGERFGENWVAIVLNFKDAWNTSTNFGDDEIFSRDSKVQYFHVIQQISTNFNRFQWISTNLDKFQKCVRLHQRVSE